MRHSSTTATQITLMITYYGSGIVMWIFYLGFLLDWLVERIGDLAVWVATRAYRIVEQSYYKKSR